MLTHRQRVERWISRCSIDENGCWIWPGALNQGYGHVQVLNDDGTHATRTLHRDVYEFFRGPVPKELHVDHLCRVRSCCNPDHLEPVTPRENILRGPVTAARVARTHCPAGHEYTAENTYVTARNQRCCKACRSARKRAQRTVVASADLRAEFEASGLSLDDLALRLGWTLGDPPRPNRQRLLRVLGFGRFGSTLVHAATAARVRAALHGCDESFDLDAALATDERRNQASP